MGRDKALLPFRGAPLGEAVARAVETAAGNVTIVGRAEFGSLRSILDRYPGEGPLGGILTALADSEADWNLIVACDMPQLSSDFLARLLDSAEKCGALALVPDGEPLCAAYHRDCREPFEAAFARGVRKILAAVAEVPAVICPIEEVAQFQNVNTPEDWSDYAAE
jgi:molybdenum cofactor guanylyltransferase